MARVGIEHERRANFEFLIVNQSISRVTAAKLTIYDQIEPRNEFDWIGQFELFDQLNWIEQFDYKLHDRSDCFDRYLYLGSC